MVRPVLGIIACNRLVEGEAAQAVMERYVRSAMRFADCAALIVPSLPEVMDVREVVDRLDGVLLTGSPSNIEPERYGDSEGRGPFDPRRDAIALSLIEAMAECSKPIFGICRGFQEINVALGGTLRRDTASNPALLRHHSISDSDLEDMFAERHKVDLVEGGLLAEAMGKTQAEVISVHYQGVDRLADGLSVEATAPDGLVEAFSARLGDAPLVAVQWHPEWRTETDCDSQSFFALLGRALRGNL